MLNNFKYLTLILGLNTLIWGSVLTYVNKAPKTYVSQWSIILPGSNSSSSVNIDQLGQATSGGDNAYVSGSIIDPRANLKAVAVSPEVINLAANISRINVTEFGQPTAKLIDPTSTVEFSIKGDSPRNAQIKAQALNLAIELKINQLRKQDIKKRNLPNIAALKSSEENLNNKRQELINFKSENGLISNEQVSSLVNTLANLKQQRILVESERQQQSSRLYTLSSQLQSSPTQVASSYSLLSDSILQQNIKDYALADTTYTTQATSLLPGHPTLVSLQEKRDGIKSSMLNRASSLVGRNITEAQLSKLLVSKEGEVGGQGNRSELYNSLISIKSDVNGLNAETNSLGTQIQQLEAQINNLARLQPILGSLEQDLRTAELVYNSTLSTIELNKGNIFTTYPLTEVLTEPNLPLEPSSPKTSLALFGGGVASLLICTALILLWIRSNKTDSISPKYSLYYNGKEKELIND